MFVEPISSISGSIHAIVESILWPHSLIQQIMYISWQEVTFLVEVMSSTCWIQVTMKNVLGSCDLRKLYSTCSTRLWLWSLIIPPRNFMVWSSKPITSCKLKWHFNHNNVNSIFCVYDLENVVSLFHKHTDNLRK